MKIRKIAVVVLAAPGLLVVAAQAPAALPEAPARQLSSNVIPTNFPAGAENAPASGPEYFVIATNVGAAPTEGSDPIVLEVELPEEIEIDAASDADGPQQLVEVSVEGEGDQLATRAISAIAFLIALLIVRCTAVRWMAIYERDRRTRPTHTTGRAAR